MAFIIHRMIGKVIYQYEVTSYRDENGKKKSKHICLGHRSFYTVKKEAC